MLSLSSSAMVVAVLGLGALVAPGAHAGQPMTYEVLTKNSMASAMMLGLLNNNTAFVLDKVEGNLDKLPSGKPVWGSLISLDDGTVRAVDVETNAFCAAGGVLPNATTFVVGGNQAVQYGGAALEGTANPYDSKDGRKSIRLMDFQSDSKQLNWDDNGQLQMNSMRWYPTTETIASGEVVIVGGASSGGYINRNTPNVDPTFATLNNQGSIYNLAVGGANPTYEYFPNRTNITAQGSYSGMQMSKFMTTTSGLNMYPHMFLLPSGRIFMNANASNIVWDHNQNIETNLPDTPDGIIRVYPASAATAMKPLTPANNYTPDILFCGGMVLQNDDQWGNYTAPNVNMFQTATSKACHSIQPEKSDGTLVNNPEFVAEDDMPVGRTMGQFIHLPTGQMLIVNGAANGTAGYGNTTWNTIQLNGQVVHLEGFASGPTLTPLLYDPDKPAGKRFTDTNFGKSQYARLYHSSAILAPDGSVIIAGSNPHNDVNLAMPLVSTPQGYNTTYVVEKWYPDYYFAPRPQPQGVPDTVTFGGKPFNVTVDKDFMGKSSNWFAASTKFMIIRPGFSTHAMNMGQRSVQLDHSYEVQSDGSVVFMVNPLPTNPNLITVGPALLFVTIGGVPSQGKFISVGESKDTVGVVPWTPKIGSVLVSLPQAVNHSDYNTLPPKVYTGTGSVKGTEVGSTSAQNGSGSSGSGSGLGTEGKIGVGVGVGVGVLAIVALVAAILFICKRRRSRGATQTKAGYTYAANTAGSGYWDDANNTSEYLPGPPGMHHDGARDSQLTFGDSFHLQQMQKNSSDALNRPYSPASPTQAYQPHSLQQHP